MNTQTPVLEPVEVSPEDRLAAAELLDEAYQSGEPDQIEAAHALVKEQQGIGSVAVNGSVEQSVHVTKLPGQRPHASTQHPFGALRRVSVTAGRMDTTQGRPKGQQSPTQQYR